jgi:hypothetical protein
MSKINQDWHMANKMPKNPTFEQRMKWHAAHAQYCGCRGISVEIREGIRKLGIKLINAS